MDVQLHGEPVLKTHLFDLQIAFEEGEFLAQRHFLGVGLFQADAQQFAEPGYDSVGVIWILMDQGGDRMERVEEEVRVQLHAQHLQSRPHQFGGERRKTSWIAVRKSDFENNGLTVEPSNLAQCLRERRNPKLGLRVILPQRHEDANSANRAALLGARSDRTYAAAK